MSGLVLVLAAASLPVDLNMAKAHLKVDDADTAEEALITDLIESGRERLDGRDGVLNRALITQTWDWTLDRFPRNRTHYLEVPLPPLQSITSITYTDSAGAAQTWGSSLYQVDTASEPARIQPAFNESWPSTRDELNAVTVRLIAGYGASPGFVPTPIRQAILFLVTDAYENRQTVVRGAIKQMPWVMRLVAPYRAVGFA